MHSKLRFLCPTHRNWVEANPERAREYLNNILQKGSEFIKQGSYSEALPYMGCAMEAIDILDTASAVPDPELLTLLPSVANSLAACFWEMGHTDVVELVAAQASNALDKASTLFETAGSIPVWVYHAQSELEAINGLIHRPEAEAWQYLASSSRIN